MKKFPEPGTMGDRIRGLREEMKLSQEEFGRLVFDGKNTVKNIELGTQDIKVEKLKEYARVLNTSVYYLITGVHDKNADIAEELGLSNASIEELKKAKDYYTYIGLTTDQQQDIVKEFGIKNYMPVQDTINVLLNHFDLLMLLHNYFFDELNEIVVEPTEDAGVLLCPVSGIMNFQMVDFESPLRIQIMDELKKIRDSTPKKKRSISGMI